MPRVRFAGAVLGTLAVIFGGVVLWEERWRGFPDSHLTEYDRAVAVPFTLLAFASFALAAYLFAVAWFARPATGRGHLLVAAGLFAFIVLARVSAVGWYFRDLDHGAGGFLAIPPSASGVTESAFSKLYAVPDPQSVGSYPVTKREHERDRGWQTRTTNL